MVPLIVEDRIAAIVVATIIKTVMVAIAVAVVTITVVGCKKMISALVLGNIKSIIR